MFRVNYLCAFYGAEIRSGYMKEHEDTRWRGRYSKLLSQEVSVASLFGK